MKHPILNNKVRFVIWWLVWLFIALGQSLLYYFAYGSFINISILDSIVSLLFYSGIALSLWYPFGIFTKSKESPATLISNILAIGTITVVLWILATKLFMSVIVQDRDTYSKFWEATFQYRVGTGVFLYGLVILTYFLFVSLTNLAEKSAREAKLESLVKETELRMLRSQINPHFLFNSLNSITSLTVTDPEKARIMVIKLSDFMRYALSKKDDQPVTLQSELENLRLYLDIEKVRFGDRLFIEENIDPSCLRALVPVMLLQPLYENAIKHGVYESTERVTVLTTVSCSDGFVEMNISNNFDPYATPAPGTGTGLLNVSRRLELLYGKRASIKTSKHDNEFIVKIFLPIDFQS